MFTLFTSLPSPYGRKVRIVIDCLGLTEHTRLQTVDTRDPDDPIRRINPLGKIQIVDQHLDIQRIAEVHQFFVQVLRFMVAIPLHRLRESLSFSKRA